MVSRVSVGGSLGPGHPGMFLVILGCSVHMGYPPISYVSVRQHLTTLGYPDHAAASYASEL